MSKYTQYATTLIANHKILYEIPMEQRFKRRLMSPETRKTYDNASLEIGKVISEIFKAADGILSMSYIEHELNAIGYEPSDQTRLAQRMEELSGEAASFTDNVTVMAGISPTNSLHPDFVLGDFIIQSKQTVLNHIPTDCFYKDQILKVEGHPLASEPFFVSVKIAAEPIRAREIGEQKIRQFFNFLQYIFALIWSWTSIPHVNFSGMHPDFTKDIFCFDDDGNAKGGQFSRVDPVQPLLFDEGFFKLAESPENIKIVKAITTESISDMESRILTSIYWLALGAKEFDDNCAVLHLTQALESLFPSPNKLRETLSNRLPIHLSGYFHGDIKGFIRDIYDLRSGLSHGRHNKLEQVSKGDISLLSRITAWSILARAKKLDEFPKREDYEAFLDKQWQTT